MDYFTSDLHFCHDREFLYGPRGFSSVAEMNEAIIKNFNESVGWEDRLYILGDVMMGFDIEAGCRLLGRLPGEKYIIRGNHDSDKKLSAMADVANVKVLGLAELYEYGKRKFYLSHYPTCTGNFSVTEKNGRKLFTKPLGRQVVNLSGHTHSRELWNPLTLSYNVALDAHGNFPVSIEEIIEDCRKFYAANNCFEQKG